MKPAAKKEAHKTARAAAISLSQVVAKAPTKKQSTIQPKATWQDIDPEMAEFYLNFNTEHNRPWTPEHVDFLASEMKGGRFKVNGDTIRIDSEGRLIDGQHRLRAIVASGMTFKMLVVEHLEPDAFVTIDLGGKSRSTSDVLAINKEKATKGLAACLTAVWRYERYDYPGAHSKVSTQELLQLLAEHPELRDVARRASGPKEAKFLRGAPGSLLLYYGGKYPEALEQFWMGLQTGKMLAENTGAYWLRERMIRMLTSAAVLRTPLLIALTIKAWNADVRGKPVKQLLWRTEEPFPRFDV